jgi:OmpA-OmpF porin, OOP family
MKALTIAGLAILLAVVACPVLLAEPDEPGSKDHPLFTRMPGYHISNYSQKDFDSCEFALKDGKTVAVEGRKTEIGYRVDDGAAVSSPIQIGRNYQNAITKVGGTVLLDELESGGGTTTLKLVRGGNETWTRVWIGDSGNNYTVVVVEKAGMQQDVVANADAWKTDIGATGHAAVYGIYFDTDKAEIKPGSEAALKEIARLLALDPKLSVWVVGHTDSTGDESHNTTLSEARARAVVTALGTKHGVAAARLLPRGVGSLAPVASNDTEEGRAKNRRVELVKR